IWTGIKAVGNGLWSALKAIWHGAEDIYKSTQNWAKNQPPGSTGQQPHYQGFIVTYGAAVIDYGQGRSQQVFIPDNLKQLPGIGQGTNHSGFDDAESVARSRFYDY